MGKKKTGHGAGGKTKAASKKNAAPAGNHPGNRMVLTKNRKKLLTVLAVCAAVLLILSALVYIVLPRLGKHVDVPQRARTQTGAFYDDGALTEAELAEYAGLVQDIYYKKDGVETLITDGSFRQAGGSAAVFFAGYIDAIKAGDAAAYGACFSEKYDFSSGFDPFATGKIPFPPQRLYDIHIESVEERYDEAAGTTFGRFIVSYRIFRNDGSFRTDIDIYNETAPLVFLTEETDGVIGITDVFYLYG